MFGYVHAHGVYPVERLTEAVLAVHEIDERDLNGGDDREATFLPVGERSEAVDRRYLDRQIDPTDAGKLSRQHDQIRGIRQCGQAPVEQERHHEPPIGIFRRLRRLHEHVLEFQHDPGVEIDREVKVERTLTRLGGMQIDLPRLTERVRLNEVALIVNVESMLDGMVLQIGNGSCEVNSHGARLPPSGAIGCGDRSPWKGMNVSWSFGAGASPHRHALVYSDGDWWYDPLSNEFGFRLGGRESREWTDTTWEFPGPDEYAGLAARTNPGWFAKSSEKAMHAAVISGDPHAIDVIAGQHPQYRNTADVLAGLMSLDSRRTYATELLSRSVAGGMEPKDDPFIKKYMPDAGLVVPIAPGVAVTLPIMRVAVALTVAELHQEHGELTAAIESLESVDRTTHVKLSLVELLCAVGRFEEAIASTDGVLNDDDVTAMTLVYRGIALREMGRTDPAKSTLGRALEYDNRSESVLTFARVVSSSMSESE